jgi:rod shape-determining protein MreD
VSLPVALLFAVIVLLLDSGIGQFLSIGPARPSLNLLFVVYAGLTRGPIEGTLFGFGIGFSQDLLGGLPMGASAFTYSVVGFACGKLWSEGSIRMIWPWGVFVLFAAVFAEAIASFLTAQTSGLSFSSLFTSAGLTSAAYTTVFGMLWFLSPLHRVRNI